MSSYTNVFGGSPVQASQVSLTRLDLDTAITTLYWPTQYVDKDNIVSRIIDVYPDENGRIVKLPDATFVSVGQDVLINNPSASSFILQNGAGTELDTIESGNIIYFYLTDNSTAAGTWRIIPFGGGVAAVTSVGVDVPDATDAANFLVTVDNPESTPVINFTFTGDLAELIGFEASTGIAVRTAKESWELRSIAAAANGNVTVTNGSGVGGNITLDLATTVGITPGQNPVTSMRVGNITISANTIVSNDANGSINLTPNGTGEIKANKDLSLTTASKLKFYNAANSNYLTISGSSLTYNLDLVLPATAPSVGQVLQYASANTLGWATVSTVTGGATTDNAIARYDGAGGVLQNSGVTISDSNALVSPGSITSNTSLIVGNTTITSTAFSNNAGPISLAPAVGINRYVEVVGDLVIGETGSTDRTLYLSNGTYTVGLTAPVLAAAFLLTLPASDGLDNALLQTNGAGALSFTDLSADGTSGQVADAAATLLGASGSGVRPVVPKYMQAHPGITKARGRVTGATGVVISQYNVNGNANRTGTGVYEITLLTQFADANYDIQISIENATCLLYRYSNVTTAGFTIRVFQLDGTTPADPTSFSFSAHGTQ